MGPSYQTAILSFQKDSVHPAGLDRGDSICPVILTHVRESRTRGAWGMASLDKAMTPQGPGPSVKTD